MENNYIKDLREVENSFNKIKDKRSKILERMHELEKIDVIIEYQKLCSSNETLYRQQNNLIEKYTNLKQKNCKHPLWYFIKEETDSYEGRTYYTCRCLECNLVEERRSRDFDNVIRGDYSKIKDDYDNRKSVPSVKAIQMIKKYSGRKK